MESAPAPEETPKGVATPEESFADAFLAIEQDLAEELSNVDLGDKVKYVYNPLSYASSPHRAFLRKYLRGRRETLFLGMNPGPWGMMQTGVPFGEVSSVTGFLGLDPTLPVLSPARYHPSRPVAGFGCKRKEVSGERLWGLIEDLCQTADHFFSHSFVHNHCPLGFLSSSGKNVTPVELGKGEARQKVMDLCDDALAKVVRLLGVKVIVGIGRFAVQRAEKVLSIHGLGDGVRVVFMNHPSPASATANRGGGWRQLALGQLRQAGVVDMLSRPPPTASATTEREKNEEEANLPSG